VNSHTQYQFIFFSFSSYLLPDKNRGSKQKTYVVKRTTNPTWNHTFVYDDVTLQELSDRALELTIWDHDRLASNEFLGGVRFSLGTGKHILLSSNFFPSLIQ
jgi:synaptotagmin-like protein